MQTPRFAMRSNNSHGSGEAFLARRTRAEAGQAMVEFVIILIIVMAVCAGMCASIRLLTFQFWARQEARFLAFERVWSADEFYSDNGQDPASLLDAGTDIGRPEIVTGRQHTRNTNDDGSVTNLLSWLRGSSPQEPEEERQDEEVPIEHRGDSKSILLARTTPGEMISWVNTAFARQGAGAGELLGLSDMPSPQPDGPREHPVPTGPKERLGRGFEGVLERHGFGPQFCDAMVKKFRGGGRPDLAAQFSDADCGPRMNEDFGMYLGENLDFQEFFHDYSDRLEFGDAPDEAMRGTIRHSVGNHFYSFFDTLVSSSRALAVPTLLTGAITADGAIAANSTRLISDARYLGSSIAVVAITVAAVQLLTPPFSNSTDADAILEKERDFIINVLHVDVGSTAGGAGYFLSPAYLPVPPVFGATAPAIQEAVMKNALFEEDSLIPKLIENSNKRVQVTYKAQGGLFPAATRRFAGIEDVELTSNYYLVAQPWHITRRISSSGEYRQKGDEFDGIDENTEEGMLRKRVSGIWLFPSNPGAFLQPISAIPGLGFLGPVFSAFEPIGSLIGIIKSFVLVDNPIFKILDMLHDLPGIGSFIPTPPKFPAVRPDAYVGSTEMTGDDTSKKDQLMGSDRNFEDYLNEQRDNNPEPNPTFN